MLVHYENKMELYEANDGLTMTVLTLNRCASADWYDEQLRSHWRSVPVVILPEVATAGNKDN